MMITAFANRRKRSPRGDSCHLLDPRRLGPFSRLVRYEVLKDELAFASDQRAAAVVALDCAVERVTVGLGSNELVPTVTRWAMERLCVY